MSDAIAVLRDGGRGRGAQGADAAGELLIRSKRGEATTVLKKVIQSYNDDEIKNTDPEGVALTARCAQLLRLPRQSNDL
ncbi:MAG: hypothetical protein R3F14_08650 [Polyangiaceae bacterium]